MLRSGRAGELAGKSGVADIFSCKAGTIEAAENDILDAMAIPNESRLTSVPPQNSSRWLKQGTLKYSIPQSLDQAPTKRGRKTT